MSNTTSAMNTKIPKSSAGSSSADEQDLAKMYQKKTDIEHILDAPDTYIGQVDEDETDSWQLNEDGKMEHTTIKWIPGLYKTFDEGIVNASDHVTRCLEKIKKKEKKIVPVKNIDIDIGDDGVITMVNGGNGIDIAKHPEYDLWIPEMIFGHLRTSTNYDKDEKKIVGGKNGFGFKLVLIYSLWGTIETVDHVRKLKYTQKFSKNLSKIGKPKISKYSGKPYTKISWLPDYKRFGIDELTEDMFNLFKKRTYDIAAMTNKNVVVKFNKEVVPIKTFEQYVNLYIGGKSETKRIYCNHSDRWEYCICQSPLDEFAQVSFVNSINTQKGGKHIDYLLNIVTKKMIAYIKKKKKVTVKANTIKEQLMIFVRCDIENPSFDSQTKDYLNTPISKFGSKCNISDKDIEKLAKMGVMDTAIGLNEIKESNKSKKTDGSKKRTLKGIPKLLDASNAGSNKSKDCTIIFCEGDSAKAGIISGLTQEDRKTIGVFPLKGKLMNVDGVSITKINNNDEITKIKKIIGLESNKKYENVAEFLKKSRYGRICFMTDQDLDGSHIKGLCLNLFHSQWKELVKFKNIFGFINTPIIKAKKGKKEEKFYNDHQYQEWKKENNDGKGWTIKYYKGLGTSNAREFKEYFKEKKFVMFNYEDEECFNSIDKVFNKGRADDRKEWLGGYDKSSILDTNQTEISYRDFIDKEFIHFSKYDCERSIPNLIDGFKTSTRKIFYACLKRKLTKEIKVAQLAGYVSEHAGYHHGEMSLNKAIVGLAQEYVGSNNINLLMPNGQFGTRLEGGKDSASERYIFTQLNTLAYKLFPEMDQKVLNYLNDDGFMVEPDFYAPIIPMILVNGGKGIGTGFSYEGLQYNVKSIIAYLKHKLVPSRYEKVQIEPYYQDFKGEIIKVQKDKYMFKGKYQTESYDTFRVTELPIGMWTGSFIEHLESLMETKDKKGKKKKAVVKNYIDHSTTTTVDFKIKLDTGILPELISKQVNENVNGLEKLFKLTTTKKTSNMYLFDEEQKLNKYETIYDIIDKYYPVRIKLYKKRKLCLIAEYEKIVKLLSNKAKFIQEQCNDEIDLRRKKKDQVIEILKQHDYDVIDGDEEYKYLRKMPIDSVIEENIEKLLNDKGEKEKELQTIKETTIANMWLSELKDLEKEHDIYLKERYIRKNGKPIKKKKLKKKK